MIGRLTGRIAERGADELILDVAGVGYRVRIPLSTFYALPDSDAGAVTLSVHTHVREDALQLYGFATDEERETFEALISISGIGPRVALAVLSGIGVDELRRAVSTEDRARLQKIPGVGKKTAERVLLELRDRLPAPEGEPGGDGSPGDRTAGADPGQALEDDAVSALANLGYTVDRARKAVEAVLDGADGTPALEAVLRAALARLSR